MICSDLDLFDLDPYCLPYIHLVLIHGILILIFLYYNSDFVLILVYLTWFCLLFYMILILVVLVISIYFDLIIVDLDHYLISSTSPDLDPGSQLIFVIFVMLINLYLS